ncbi:Rieske 2Fe-2S domain-containing protein [Filomicrobium sp.]|uniref:Rieske 2Fe-2S domain-containing protein n=1 Tax=Filomicrobium sp. TaxID=2024831 RepID=UPI0025863B7D|nr:Rieske 2Fe-2S domain-containing protein [Filomicrobium sp.]MCV0370195.1 Rieske 2Fe-2S domain-containing protein [Filomicrobium sp.]
MKFVCHVSEIGTGEMKGFDVGDVRVLVLNADGEIKACDGICPHQEVLLEEGIFDGCLLTCHSHLWQWNIKTGSIEQIAEQNLRFFRIEVRDGSVFVCTNSDGGLETISA